MDQKIAPVFNDQLVLYYHSYSFYSQKVLFVLYEKNIKFTPYELDVTNGEQYAQWFLDLNPKGEVPVLQDGTLIIPESGRIINYLEDHFNMDNVNNNNNNNNNKNNNNYYDTPRLIPKYFKEKTLNYYRRISRLPIGAISMGSFIHTDLCPNPKPPFIGLVRYSFLKTDDRIENVLIEYTKINPQHADILREKLTFQERKLALVRDRDEFLKILNAVEFVLNDIERDISENQSDFKTTWLCSNDLTIADISLGLFLHRLYGLGFENYFWKGGRRPYIEQFYHKISERTAFKKVLPTTFANLKTVWSKTPNSYKYGMGAISAAVLVTSFIVQK